MRRDSGQRSSLHQGKPDAIFRFCPLPFTSLRTHNMRMRDEDPISRGGFAYRQNADGTIDSICLRCFLTAGKALKVAALHEIEKQHDCHVWMGPVDQQLPASPAQLSEPL